MVEVRKSTRIKSEPGLKRRFSDALEAESTPAKPAKHAKTKSVHKAAPKAPTPPEPTKLIIPAKLTDATPLPVLPKPQPDELEETEWQDLSTSGVFAASLARSRKAITQGAFFHKFWTKPIPTKKLKDMTEEEKAALKAAKGPTQSKVGMAKMISEPLTFECQLFMIKDQLHGQKQGQLPQDRMHLVYGTPVRTPAPMYTPSQSFRPAPQPVHPQTPLVRPPIQAAPGPMPQQHVAPMPRPVQTPQSQPPRTSTPVQVKPSPAPSQALAQPATSTAPSTAPSTPAAKPNPQTPDPVIHALAQRASANPELKAVMKIVATGKASQQQLQYFQKHIDELTEMVRKRQEQDDKSKAPSEPSIKAATPGPAPTANAAPVVKQDNAMPPLKQELSTPAPAQGSTAAASNQPPARPPSTPAQNASAAPPTERTATSTQSAPSPAPAVQRTATPTQVAPSQPPQATQPASQAPISAATPQAVPTPPQQQYRPPPPQPVHQNQTPHSPAHPTQPQVPRFAPAPLPPTNYQPQLHPNTPQSQQTFTPITTNQQSYYHNSQLASGSYTAPPRPKMVTTATPLHILIAFGENTNDRFLFPPSCILEWNATLTEVVCSFVVSKDVPIESDKDSAIDVGSGKGKSKENGKEEKRTKEVWAPVTVTFRGDAPTLSVLGRVAEPIEVARRNMEDQMCRGERGEDGWLALRLPIEAKEIDLDG